jgi:hypothetical protein
MNVKKQIRQPSDHIHEFPLGRNILTPGVECSIKGKRGRFRFQYARPAGDLTLIGGPLHGQRDRFVSVQPNQIARVWRDRKTLVNIQRDKLKGS